jgi:hypothetical protein
MCAYTKNGITTLLDPYEQKKRSVNAIKLRSNYTILLLDF